MSSIFQAFEWINVPFGYLFKWRFSLTNNYLLALFVFCVVMKLLLLPLSIRQQKDMYNRTKLAPQEKAIRRQYQGKTDEQPQNKMNRKLMELYTQNTGQQILLARCCMTAERNPSDSG